MRPVPASTDLVLVYLDGRADETQVAELLRRLPAEPELAERLVVQARLMAMLADLRRRESHRDEAEAALHEMEGVAAAAPGARSDDAAGRSSRRRRWLWGGFGVAAAVVLAVFALLQVRTPDRPGTATAPETVAAGVAASPGSVAAAKRPDPPPPAAGDNGVRRLLDPSRASVPPAPPEARIPWTAPEAQPPVAPPASVEAPQLVAEPLPDSAREPEPMVSETAAAVSVVPPVSVPEPPSGQRSRETAALARPEPSPAPSASGAAGSSPEAKAPPVIAKIAVVRGRVYVPVADPAARRLLAPGDAIRWGMGLVTDGDTSGAVVAFPDATRIELGGNTTVARLADGDPSGAPPDATSKGKQVSLSQGMLNATVAPQPRGRPLTLDTPHGDLQVLGTEFTVTCGRDVTVLKVWKGAVKLTRAVDGKDIVVKGGFQAAIDARRPKTPQPKVESAPYDSGGKRGPSER